MISEKVLRLTDEYGVVLEAGVGVDTSRKFSRLTTFDGLFGGADVAPRTADRLTNGTIFSGTRRGARAMTIGGLAGNMTGAEVIDFEMMLSGILGGDPGSGVGLLEARQGDLQLHAQVYLDGAPKIAGNRDLGYVTWQLPISSDMPYLYGPEQQWNLLPPGSDVGLDWPLFDNDEGVLTWGSGAPNAVPHVTNHGTAPAYPRIVVRGDFPSGVRIGNGLGSRVVYQAGCSISSPVTFDFESRSAFTPTGDATVAITTRDFWSVAPGETIQPTLEPLQEGGGSATLYMCDTYF